MKQPLHSSLEIVVGLPAAGKTTYLEKQRAAGVIDSFYDDYRAGTPEENSDNPRTSPNFQLVSADIEAGKKTAIADILYCEKRHLDLALNTFKESWPQLPITITYFANDAAACKQNVRQRARPERVDIELQFINDHSPSYMPSGEHILPVIIG